MERASSSAGTRSVTVRPSTVVRSVIANSRPSSAAARSTSLVGAETNPSRSAITPGSESGTVPAASRAWPAPSTVMPADRASAASSSVR